MGSLRRPGGSPMLETGPTAGRAGRYAATARALPVEWNMSLREFVDGTGKRWKAWDITPDRMHPSTRAEDYMQPFLDGWLVFESLDGGVKRRLHPIPPGWAEMAPGELERLCTSATGAGGTEPRNALPGTPPTSATDEARAAFKAAPTTRSSGEVMRSFDYPGGRHWTVGEMRLTLRTGSSDQPVERRVLRFTSGARALDLSHVPANWWEYRDDALAELLYRGFPRDRSARNRSPHRRRRDEMDESQ